MAPTDQGLVEMFVIISDLHLTDGSAGATISPGAFSLFAERLSELATSAGWRLDGRYRPIDGLELLLLGDVLDVIRSSQWLAQDRVRPWSNPHSPEFVDVVSRITSDILRHNDEAVSLLRGVSAQGGITVPAADRMGRPAPGSPPVPVQVRTYYMVGNHDWMFHLRGGGYDLLRQAIARQMGLANAPGEPFAHDPAECDPLYQSMRRHRLFARHGDVYDPFNFEGDRDASSLGDALVVELVTRFSATVEAELAAELPPQLVLGLREIDNVRPVLLVPVWIDGLLERTCSFTSQRKMVERTWDRLADEFLSLPLVRQRDTWNPNDLVDGLQRVLKFSKRLPTRWASAIVTWLSQQCGCGESSYFRHALAEQDFRNRRAKHIVFGHTHQAECVPLDASYAEASVLDQVYFNSGTWRRVHRQTALAPAEHEFIASDVMTYLAFFQGDERGGRPYESWSGTLGLAPSCVPIHRIDAGRTSHATRQPLSAPIVHTHAPHFAPSTVGAGIVPRRRV